MMLEQEMVKFSDMKPFPPGKDDLKVDFKVHSPPIKALSQLESDSQISTNKGFGTQICPTTKATEILTLMYILAQYDSDLFASTTMNLKGGRKF